MHELASLEMAQARWLLDTQPDPVLMLDGWRIEACNQAALEWLRCPDVGSLIGAHPARISNQMQASGEPSMDLFNRLVDEAMEQNETRTQWVFQRIDGTDAYADMTLKRLQVGGHVRVFAFLHDTSRYQAIQTNLAHSNDRYRQIFEASPDPLWLVKGQIFIDCNWAAVKALGYQNKADLLNRHPSELSPAAQPDGESSYAKANRMGKIAFKQGVHRFEWVHLRADGQEVLSEVVLRPLTLQSEAVMYCAWRDIGSRQKHEDMLMAIIADLQAQLEQQGSGEMLASALSIP